MVSGKYPPERNTRAGNWPQRNFAVLAEQPEVVEGSVVPVDVVLVQERKVVRVVALRRCSLGRRTKYVQSMFFKGRRCKIRVISENRNSEWET